MNRREARERAFQLIYEMSAQTDKTTEALISDTASGQDFRPDDYIRGAVAGVREKTDELDALISGCAVGWRIERMSAVSLAILRLAVYEMLYVDDVPFSVAINEAVEAAKKYDHGSAPKFINGILNAVAVKTGLKTSGTGTAGKKTEAGFTSAQEKGTSEKG